MNKNDFYRRFVKGNKKVEFIRYKKDFEVEKRKGYPFTICGVNFYVERNQEITDENGFFMGSFYKDVTFKQFQKMVYKFYDYYIEGMKKLLNESIQIQKQDS